MAEPTNTGVAQVPVQQDRVAVPQFRFLKPSMFKVANWDVMVMGLTPQQQQVFWDRLSRFDTQQAARNLSLGTTGKHVWDQLREQAMAAPPPVPNQPPPPATPVADPNALDPNEIANQGQPNKPQPHTEDPITQPKTGDTRMNNGVQEVFVNGAWRPMTTNAGPQTPYTGSGDTSTPGVNVNPATPAVNTNNANAGSVTAVGWNSHDPNTPPPYAPPTGKEWFYDAANRTWKLRGNFQTAAPKPATPIGNPNPAQVMGGHSYSGYNYLYDPVGQRYVRAGKIGGRGIQFAGSPFGAAAGPAQFIDAAEWNRLMGKPTTGGGSVARVPRGGGV